MSDVVLQELRRRAVAGDGREVGRAWVAAAIRAGRVDPELVPIAAAVGDVLALEYLGESVEDARTYEDLAKTLSTAGPPAHRDEAMIRAAAAAARLALEEPAGRLWTTEGRQFCLTCDPLPTAPVCRACDGTSRPRRSLHALREWIGGNREDVDLYGRVLNLQAVPTGDYAVGSYEPWLAALYVLEPEGARAVENLEWCFSDALCVIDTGRSYPFPVHVFDRLKNVVVGAIREWVFGPGAPRL